MVGDLERKVNRFDWKGIIVLGALLAAGYYAWNYGMDCTFKNTYLPHKEQQEQKQQQQRKEEENDTGKLYFTMKYQL